ncbi:hypothetical protein [Tissierella creatinophila]|uniref:Uncharacterized protein n=1 Tax=Tissierella creatinophila DSM 6911 TaxID=1123403 RepID=A0A1U7M6J7_TISCR|nr:hypothetical protein [Tissierella creatinophila]OLS02911.1 hypothetical protein TICRE_10650 [Tissierella creatinophila DSM 6911]
MYEIKGFKNLSNPAKRLFGYVYQKHQAGVEDKEDWTAIKVKERKNCIEVTFRNGKWLNYYTNGTWG